MEKTMDTILACWGLYSPRKKDWSAATVHKLSSACSKGKPEEWTPGLGLRVCTQP